MRSRTLMPMLLAGTVLMLAAAAAQAQVSQAEINALVAAMQAEPNNLDHLYHYAKIAEAMEEWEKAAQAYRYMLERDPRLDRVRLDLSLVYIKQQKIRDARSEMQRVLWNNPPEEVKATVKQVLSQLPPDDPTPHQWSGFVAAGINNDSNATSPPGSGSVTVLDTSVTLDSATTGKEDQSAYLVAGLDHQYQSPDVTHGVRPGWRSSVQAYTSAQQDQDQLDIQLVGVRTGPQAQIPAWAATLALTGGVTYVTLDNEPYLWSYTADVSLEKTIGQRAAIIPALVFEERQYRNSPAVSTYTDRDGPAYQFTLTGRYLLTETGMLDVTGLLRREYARQDYYSNDQYGISGGYTHLFPMGYFAGAGAGYKYSGYDTADTLISSDVRVDQETSASVSAGRNFDGNVTLTGTYQYRDIGSSIQNYDYDNHRFGASLGWRF